MHGLIRTKTSYARRVCAFVCVSYVGVPITGLTVRLAIRAGAVVAQAMRDTSSRYEIKLNSRVGLTQR